ncbi:hypothetical protein ODS88_24035 [Escherichia coli]|nr:hypothetical protein [Escherichia coli]MCV8283053.1 hypothetical protein [Escherichia coli]MCV8517905.1 hypothetical protein [Escherichia coli]MCV8686420.1 hypothetical protein [Escherichia coli]MCV8812551.1 hypothetical protein [Escherichia coli]MCV8968328.1 hypothetical protein [Escherichia coli]
MNRSDSPKKQPKPFGVNGQREDLLPTTPAGDNTASYDLGFPPITMILKSAGGLPPKGQDMNQILYELSSLCRWSSAGALNAFDSDFSTAVGGYPLGAVLISDDGATIYISTINNNTNDPNTSSAGWSPLSDYLKMRESFTGVVGQAVNQKMSVAIASASATFTADQVIVGESLSGKQYRLSSVNKTINLTTTGAGGMDTGSAPASGWVAIYLIYNPTTDTSALLAQDVTSIIAPTVYGGANMPAGYTASALVSVWGTTSGALLKIGYQRGRKFATQRVDVLSTSSNPGGYTPISLTNAIPKNAATCTGYVFCNTGEGDG